MQYIIPYNVISLLPGLIYFIFSGSFIYSLIIYITPFLLGNLIFGDWYRSPENLGTNNHFIVRGCGNIIIVTCLAISISILSSKGYL